MSDSGGKNDSVISQLKKYVNDDEDPLVELSKLLNSSSKKKKAKKQRQVMYQRDKYGTRTYPYRGKRTLSKSKRQPKLTNDPLIKIMEKSSRNTEEINQQELDNPVSDFQTIKATEIRKKIKRKTWQQRMNKIEDTWEEERETVLRILVEMHNMEGNCMICHLKKAVISCNDCLKPHLCELCDLTVHENAPLHNRTSYAKYIQPIPPTKVLNSCYELVPAIRFVPLRSPVICKCGSKDFKKVPKDTKSIVITMKGKYLLSQFQAECCHCKNSYDPFTLRNIIDSGYWPSSPRNFGCLVKEEVFLTWNQFRKQMPGSSELSFLESLNSLTVYFGRTGRISHSSFSHPFKQWNFVKYEFEKIQGINWMKCPCCTIKQHSCHVDGNCKLYRYKNSGSRRRQSYYKDVFIVDDCKVDEYLSALNISKEKPPPNTSCGGEWSAARNISRKKNSVDYTGLDVASCRHQFGQKAVNMKRGEIYAYPMYLLQTFIIPNNTTFIFADVMCKLWPYMCRIDSTVSTKIKGALSVMHAKGHNLSCQVKWDGEWIKGTGKSTGEECEQVFSFLSRCANTTKYQIPENREETLTEMIMFWNRRKTLKLAESLSKKYKKVKEEKNKHLKSLTDKCSEMQISLDEVDFETLFNDMKNAARGGLENFEMKLEISCHVSQAKPTSFQQLILLTKEYLPTKMKAEMRSFIEKINLPDLSNLNIPLLAKKKSEKISLLASLQNISLNKQEMIESLKDLNQKILAPAFQNAIHSCRFEIVEWNKKVKKYADSAKSRFAFRKQLSDSNIKLKSLIGEFAKIKSVAETTEFDILQETNRRILLEWNAKKARCSEELLLIVEDMKSYLSYYTTLIATLKSKKDVLPESENGNSFDQKPVIRSGIIFAEKQLGKGLKHFSDVLSVEATDYFKCGISSYLMQVEESNEEEEKDEEQNKEGESKGDVVDEQSDDGESDDEKSGSEEDGEIDEDEIILDYNILRNVGLEMMESVKEDDCQTGENFVILPPNLCQSTLGGRNGSSACSVISLITGCFINHSNHISFRESLPVYIGCIEAGNSLHKGPEFLLVEEAIKLLPFNAAVYEERDCYKKDLKSLVLQIFQESKTIILISNDSSVCLVKLENQKVFLFDSHKHNDMGALIAWTEKDFDDIIPFLPCRSSNDSIYLASIIYD